MLKLKDFNYELPKKLIAQKPVSPRDQSRLLVLKKKTGRMEHRHFYDLVDFVKAGDVLVINDTKVMPARLIGRREETGGKVEVFLLKKLNPPKPPFKRGVGRFETWQCLIGGPRRKENLRLSFSRGLKAVVIKNNTDGTWQIKFNQTGEIFKKTLAIIGRVPLPPYIKRPVKAGDRQNYQTVYADAAKLGSVAAPTAGFHFTRGLMKQLEQRGVKFVRLTLKVGLGTFAPVKTDDIGKHKMHAEWFEINKRALDDISKAKKSGGKIIAVGTTSLRTLETIFKNRPPVKKISGWTDIFIYPPYRFKIVDAMVTNFHLPQTTLLMLVSAMAGRDKIFKAYGAAIRKKYRFFSYGDAMLII